MPTFLVLAHFTIDARDTEEAERKLQYLLTQGPDPDGLTRGVVYHGDMTSIEDAEE